MAHSTLTITIHPPSPKNTVEVQGQAMVCSTHNPGDWHWGNWNVFGSLHEPNIFYLRRVICISMRVGKALSPSISQAWTIDFTTRTVSTLAKEKTMAVSTRHLIDAISFLKLNAVQLGGYASHPMIFTQADHVVNISTPAQYHRRLVREERWRGGQIRDANTSVFMRLNDLPLASGWTLDLASAKLLWWIPQAIFCGGKL